jgi:hypothetical protein
MKKLILKTMLAAFAAGSFSAAGRRGYVYSTISGM